MVDRSMSMGVSPAEVASVLLFLALLFCSIGGSRPQATGQYCFSQHLTTRAELMKIGHCRRRPSTAVSARSLTARGKPRRRAPIWRYVQLQALSARPAAILPT